MFARRRSAPKVAAALLPAIVLAATPAGAQDGWQPFDPFADLAPAKPKRPPPSPADQRPYLRPMAAPADGVAQPRAPHQPSLYQSDAGRPGTYANDSAATSAGAVMQEAMPPPVDKGDLAPVMAADGSGLPMELWNGLDTGKLEQLIGSLEIPPRSPTLHKLWTRLITASTSPGQNADSRFTALRLEALYRSGLAQTASDEIARLSIDADPLLTALAARNNLATGKTDVACERASKITTLKGDIPSNLKAQAVLMTGYCAAAAGDAASAGLAAELAREEGIETSPGLQALDALSIGAQPAYTPVKTISLLDARIAAKVKPLPHKDVLDHGEPALLAALATDAETPVDLGLPATEAAARLNALTPQHLAAIYRANAAAGPADTGPDSTSLGHRAALLKSAEDARDPARKAQLMSAFLDDAKRAGLGFQAMEMLAPALASLPAGGNMTAFTDNAVEIALAAGDYPAARRWVDSSGGRAEHWRALIDIADPNEPNRGASLAGLDQLAIAGRFHPDVLHRLATVLEALDYVVPIPLWDAANRMPQPTGGYLPETGVLSELQEASTKRQFGRTVLLTMKSLGPTGAEGANLIALGDGIRALRRAGLETDARRLALEALLGAWPRSANVN